MSVDPQSEILSRIQLLGYSGVLDFFERNPGKPFGVLLRAIARPVEGSNHLDIPLFSLRELYRHEAVQAGLEREFAKDSLVRSLRENLGKGWNKGRDAKKRRARAISSWSIPSDDCEQLCFRVLDTLNALNPPDEWRPEAVADEYIEKAFDLAWPDGV